MTSNLIYGKSNKDYIVNISVKDDKVHIYREMPGGLSVEIVDMEYYILKSDYMEGDYVLKGQQHYKYAEKYTTSKDLYEAAQRHKYNNEDIFRIYNNSEAYMTKNGDTYFKGMTPSDVSVLSFDIETTGLAHDKSSFVLLISNTFRDAKGKITKKLFKYDKYEKNKEMISDWCKWVRAINPSIMMGHNIFGFDLPYLKFCAEGAMHLGRDGSPIKFNKNTSEKRKDGSQSYSYNNATVFGREIVDTMFLAINFATPNGRDYASYGLKNVISHEGLEKDGRIIWDFEKNPVSNIIDAKNSGNGKLWNQFCTYCEDDGDDALALFDLMIPAYFYLNMSVPMTLQQIVNRASGSQVNALMVRSYLQEGHSIAKASPPTKYQGAISFGNPGLYTHVYKVDVASLYPSIIRQYDVCDKKKDPNGNFLTIVKVLTEERLENKRKGAAGDKNAAMLEKAQKIIINSAYGFLGAPGLNYNSPTNAALVTRHGREILDMGIKWAEDKGYNIVNVDTDSFSYTSGKKMDNFEAQIDELNDLFPELIIWEDDGVYNKFLVIKAKNYVTVQGKKIKYKGSSIKDSKKEPILKELMYDVINNFLDKKKDRIYDTYMEYIHKASYITEIAPWCSKKTITKAVLEGKDTTQKRIKAAIGEKEVQEGDKVYMFYKDDQTLQLREEFTGEYCKPRMYARVYNTMGIFKEILDVDVFPNFSLARNKDRI